MNNFRQQIATQFYQNSQISREDIFGELDNKYLPINYIEDARTMFSGFAGEKYKKNGVVFFGVNPGGGGDGYNKHPKDDELYSELKRFKTCSEEDIISNFEKINNIFLPILKEWNLWRIFDPALCAVNTNINEIIYLNFVPYRTRGDKKPPVFAQKNSWIKIIQPTLKILQPKIIISLGKKAGEMIERFNENQKFYVVPRTIGDSSISPEAKIMLEKLKNEYGT